MAPIKLRVFYETKNGQPVDMEKVVEWIRSISPTHFVVRHEADSDDSRPHIHAILFTPRPAQSLRDAIKKAVPSTTRQYSIGEVTDTQQDIATYERYMCHAQAAGDPVNIISASPCPAFPEKYSQAWANAQNQQFWQYRAIFVRTQQSAKTTLEKVLERCRAANHTHPNDIVDHTMAVYREENRNFNTFHMRAVARAAMYEIGGNKVRVHLRDEILRGLDFIS